MYHCICANKLYFIPPYWFKDVALVRLSEPMVFTTSLLPICLPSPTSGGEIHFCWDPFCIEPFLPSANFSDRHLCRAQFLPRPFFDRVIYFEPHFCLAPFLLSVIFAERPSFGWEPFLLRAILPSTILGESLFCKAPFWPRAMFAVSHLFLPRAIYFCREPFFCCASLALRDILCC